MTSPTINLLIAKITRLTRLETLTDAQSAQLERSRELLLQLLLANPIDTDKDNVQA